MLGQEFPKASKVFQILNAAFTSTQHPSGSQFLHKQCHHLSHNGLQSLMQAMQREEITFSAARQPHAFSSKRGFSFMHMIFITDNRYFTICKQAALAKKFLWNASCTLPHEALLSRKRKHFWFLRTLPDLPHTLAADVVFTLRTYLRPCRFHLTPLSDLLI